MQGWNISYGTGFCTGESHYRYAIGYQDAAYSICKDNLLVSVVCDGCSTTENGFSRNHVGAVLGAEIIARQAFEKLTTYATPRNKKRRGRSLQYLINGIAKSSFRVLRQVIDKVAPVNSGNYRSMLVNDKFLFTVSAIAIVENQFFFFGCGDGCFGINRQFYQTNTSDSQKYFLSQFDVGQTPNFTLFENGIIKPNDIFWVASDGILEALASADNKALFLQFLNDSDVTNWSGGRDQTIKAFRKLKTRIQGKFADDATIVVAKVTSNHSTE